MTNPDPVAVLMIMAQEADQSANSFRRMAERISNPAMAHSRNRALQDAHHHQVRADSLRAGARALSGAA